jgi:hypothetical protein
VRDTFPGTAANALSAKVSRTIKQILTKQPLRFSKHYQKIVVPKGVKEALFRAFIYNNL